MPKSNQKSTAECCLWLPFSLCVLMVVCASPRGLGMSTSMPAERGIAADPNDPSRGTARQSAGRMASMGFETSLEMKENVGFLLTPALLARESLTDDKTVAFCFDATIELHAPLCQTYVVLFARYWVSPRSYRVAVVWAEPHAGSMNFPVYPPTLSIVSDVNSFTITHQLVLTYDGVFPKPLAPRGPFRHRFNSYPFSEIRFAEQEALELRQVLRDRQGADGTGATPFHRREILLPERSILVGFRGKGPIVTIAGESRQYSELEVPYPEGGRRFVVDYQVQKIGEHRVALPAQITVHSGDGKRLLRAARLSRFVAFPHTADQIQDEAQRFSFFDPDEVRCRELLIQYWMKNPKDIGPNDVEVLRGLRARLANRSCAGATLGEQLKRVNEVLELDWMLADGAALERDFRDYLSLLSANGLGRMILFGGQNIIDTAIRWGWLVPTEKPLALWVEAARAHNDIASILEFAGANIATGRVWTTVKVLDRTLVDSGIPPEERFVAEAYRCLALGRIYEMVKDPDHKVRTELDTAQVRWVLAHHKSESLLADLTTKLDDARRIYAGLTEPTGPQRALRRKLDTLEQSVSRSHEP
jgi:hypothetical protein